MKARTKTTRWLAAALLIGLMAAAGLTLTYHHGVATLAGANDAAAPGRTALQLPHAALLASAGGTRTVVPHAYGIAESSYSSQTPEVTTNHSDSKPDASPAKSTAPASHATDPTDDPIGAPQPQNHPATSGTNHVPQPEAGDFAGQVYAPLGCELPAGCGVVGGAGYVIRQTSGTSGGLPAVHNSQGSNSGNDDPSPPPNNGSPQTSDSGENPPPGQRAAPPGKGSDPPAISAPELDAGTLAAAITLLLGSLAILRGRRPARATR